VHKNNLFSRNFGVHNHDNKSANNFHIPITHLLKYQKAVHYAGIKISKHLATHTKRFANEIKVLKRP
jgi:hypothetical protein